MNRTLSRAINRLSHRVTKLLLSVVSRSSSPVELARLGSVYGGWFLPRASLGEGAIAHCFGAGEDISFDIALVEAGCDVYCFDPTPRAIEYVNAHGPIDHPRFHFFPYGIWTQDVDMKFFAPASAGHVSHSITNAQVTDSYFVATCRSLPSLMAELGHERIDILKLDIEGAELDVLEALLETELMIPVICVEFDQPRALRRIVKLIRGFRSSGYVIVGQEDRSATLVSPDEIGRSTRLTV